MDALEAPARRASKIARSAAFVRRWRGRMKVLTSVNGFPQARQRYRLFRKTSQIRLLKTTP